MNSYALSLTPGDLLNKKCKESECVSKGWYIPESTYFEFYEIQKAFWCDDMFKYNGEKKLKIGF